MVTQRAHEPIPHPPRKPIVGNMLDVGTTTPIQDLMGLARELGPIFELEIAGRPFVVASSLAYANELCDETRFEKSVRGALYKLREIAGDALFTAFTSEPNWSKAHNVLLPNFGERAMQSYFPAMLDIAEQMMLKWERMNADDEVDVVHDMTALTLDTIGVCGFGYRFNSFYRDGNHPFVDAMVQALEISMSERGLPFEELFNKGKQRRMEAHARFMNEIVDRIIADRRAERSDDDEKVDLLDYMLSGVDRRTGEKLDDLNIRHQIITFLIAGHETTSGLLSFTTYFLLNHPEVLAKAHAEVDRVLGTDPSVSPTFKQIGQLRYVQQILKESLRMWPTAPAFALLPFKDEILGGKYFVPARSQNILLLPMLHRDPAVWGERAEIFDPDNFLPEREAAIPNNAYKPFGNGMRACIGRQFAMQEATLVIAMMLQRFSLIDHLRYKLKIKETLTLKPEGLKIKVKPRTHRHVHVGSNGARVEQPAPEPDASPAPARPRHGTPLLILFGSNLGTSEDIARKLAETATAQGYDAKLSWLDDVAGTLPTQGAVVIVTASYNGAPPDNAVSFCKWLGSGLAPGALANVRYTVFGAGNRNWQSTYQAVPRLIDDALAAHGAERIYPRGEGDARDDLDAHFDAWNQALWPTLAEKLGVSLDGDAAAVERPMYAFAIVAGPQPNPLAAAHGATTLRVLANRELQTGAERSTRHIEVALPAGASYKAGDHLGVIPSNGEWLVERVVRRFGFEPNTYIRLTSTGPMRIASLPVDATLSLRRLLMHYVELQQVATRKQILVLAEHTRCPSSNPALLRLASDEENGYLTEVKQKRRSVLDLLEQFPACELPFPAFLEMLPLMTPRYYSISSSPAASPDRVSITVGVVSGPAWSGSGSYAGVASTHLAARNVGDRVNAFVKDSKSGFKLPDDPTRPIVMVGPGTGLAPFRGFLQERAVRAERGERLGTAMLFFGCRRRDEDFIYREELEAHAAAGIVDLEVAFSREGPMKTYVQHRIAARGDDVWRLLQDGAVVYVCGDGSRMEPDVRATLARLYMERSGGDAAAAEAWLADMTAQERYVLDVWATT